jgi:hypothetical protein
MTENVEYDEDQKRPVLLLVLAILSFISIGFAILGNLVGITGGPMNENELIEQSVELTKSKTQMRELDMDGFVTFFDKLEGMVLETNENFYLAKVIMFITDFIGLFGVIFMMRRRKLGFHLYIVYSLLALGGMYLYVSPQNIHISLPIVSVIFTGLFVFLYSRTLSWMR